MSDLYTKPTDAPLGAGFKTDAFIPMAILSATLIVLLAWQVIESSSQKTLIENAISRQEPAVNQATQVQTGVSKLVSDLLQAAQTDDAAKAIVTKYKIQQTTPAGGAAAPATSPAP